MGTCGCGDFYPDFKFEGPEGSLYALQIYRGCEGCQTPVGVIISRLDGREEIESWDADSLPELPFDVLSESYRERLLPVVDPMAVATKLDLDHDRTEVYRAMQSTD